jgi:hypothetical protein
MASRSIHMHYDISREIHDYFRYFHFDEYLSIIEPMLLDEEVIIQQLNIQQHIFIDVSLPQSREKNKMYSYLYYMIENHPTYSKRDKEIKINELGVIFNERLKTMVFGSAEYPRKWMDVILKTFQCIFSIYIKYRANSTTMTIAMNQLPFMYCDLFITDCILAKSRTGVGIDIQDIHRNVSCTQGILERFIISFQLSMHTLYCDNQGQPIPDLEALCLFFKFFEFHKNQDEFNMSIREWIYQQLTPEEEKEYSNGTVMTRKNSLVRFLVKKYLNTLFRQITKPPNIIITRKVVREITERLNRDPYHSLNFKCRHRDGIFGDCDVEGEGEHAFVTGGKRKPTKKYHTFKKNRNKSKRTKQSKQIRRRTQRTQRTRHMKRDKNNRNNRKNKYIKN